jgi:hypothetical protein
MRWRDVRAAAIALAIALGMVEGCPVLREHPVRRAVLAPVDWIPRGFQISQRWALFAGGGSDRLRFEIHARTADAADTVIFRAGDPDHADHLDWLAQRRIRGVWNPRPNGPMPGQYAAFARWFARQIFDERPEVVTVWFRFERIAVTGGVPAGTGTYKFAIFEHRGRP